MAMTNNSTSPDDSAPSTAPTELQQLEAALRAKAISPELFATLAAQLRAGAAPAAPPAAPRISISPAAEPAELPSLLSLFESPPVVPAPLPAPPAPLPPPVPAAPVGALPLPRQPATNPLPPTWAAPPVAAAQVPVPPAAPPAAPAPVYVPPLPEPEPEPAAPPQRNALTTLLAVLGGVGLLGVGLYLYVDQSHPSENLTGPQPAPTEEAAPARTPEPATAVVAVPETVREAAPTIPATDSSILAAATTGATSNENPAPDPATTPEESADAAASENSPAAAATAVVSAPVPAAPEPGDDEATQKIRTVLADYYADLFAPPLAAENYFAPQVERLYIQQHLTPAQINTTITQTFFPDNKKAVYQVEPGTLRVSAPVQDGSRTATYSEACRLFRVSKGRYQRLRTQVRVKFDADYRITFLRQEKMLENVFE